MLDIHLNGINVVTKTVSQHKIVQTNFCGNCYYLSYDIYLASRFKFHGYYLIVQLQQNSAHHL